MKNIYSFLVAVALVTVALLTQGCDGMDDNFRQYMGERNYSGRVTNLTVVPGFERVLLRWDNPTDQRSKTIRIIYGPENNVRNFDSLVDYASIDGLVDATGREFTVFTVDAFGNLSVPTSVTAIPVSQTFVNNLTAPTPISQAVGLYQAFSFIGASGTLMSFAGHVEFTLTDSEGNTFEGAVYLPEQIASPQVNLSVPDLGIGMDIIPPGLYRLDYRMTVLPVLGGVLTEDPVWLTGGGNVTVPAVPLRVNLMTQAGTISENVWPYQAQFNLWNWHAGEAAEALVDGDTHSKWQVRHPHDLARRPNGVIATWRLTDGPLPITEYTLVSARDHGTFPGDQRDPMDWTLEASNDNATWTVLHEIAGTAGVSVWSARQQRRTFDVDTQGVAYRYFRLVITRAHHNDGVQLGEWELVFDRTL